MRRLGICAALLALALISGCGSTNEASTTSVSGAAEPSGASAPVGRQRGASADSPGRTDAGTGGRSAAGDGSVSAPRASQTSSVDAAPIPPGSNRDPIEVGVLYVVNDGAASAGIDNGDTISTADVVRAFVESYNASGGIAGRPIRPVYANIHSASHDYEGQAQSVCATFTEDHHVAVVLSVLGYYSETLFSCLAKASVPIIGGDWTAPDVHDAKRFPLFVTPNALLGETRVELVIDRLKASGWLRSGNRVGVVIEDCPVNQRIYANGLAPAAKRAGLQIASTFATQCFRSIQDFADQTSEMSAAVLRFRQARVDRVMVVSQGAEANLIFAFSTVAQQQGWHPGYAVSSAAAPEALALNAPKEQLENVRGVGWLPVVDSMNLAQAPPTTTGQSCLDRMKRTGITPASNTDYVTIYGPCDVFAVYDKVLRATRGDARSAAISGAVRDLSDDYVSALTVDGRTTTSGGRLRPGAGRLFAWTAKGRFEYTSAAFTL